MSARRSDDDVVVAVADTGPGIGSADLPHIFEEFFLAGGTTTHRGRSGLGLAVSKRFAELHRGTMWVESTPGKGSIFFVRLPIGEEAVPTRTAEDASADRVAARLRGQAERRVLVVDDSGDLSRIISRYLDGYHVVSTADLDLTSGSEIVPPAHAVVVGSGTAHERWSALSRSLPALQRMPVIACSLQSIRKAADDLGVSEYMVKPISRDQLRGALRRLGPDRRTVLVVEDNAEMARLLSRMVRSVSRRYQVSVAGNGEQALTLMREQRPDVVLLDLVLPTLDGYGVLEAMRADPGLDAIPVIVITAKGAHTEAVMAHQVSLTKKDGLTVAELMRWLSSGLDALAAPGTTVPTSRAVPAV